MTIKKIELQERNESNTGWDTVYQKTTSDLVLHEATGKTAAEHMDDLNNPHQVTSEQINKLENDFLAPYAEVATYPRGISIFYITSTGIQAWMDSVGLTGLAPEFVRGMVETTRGTFGAIQTVTIYNYGSGNEYKLYGIYKRMSNGATFGRWDQVVTYKETNNVVSGMYTGDGNPSQFINLGFTPKALHVTSSSGGDYANKYALSVTGAEAYNVGGLPAVEITTNGFNVYFSESHTQYLYSYVHFNNIGNIFRYVAFR
jgi:hypothetical protein